MFKKILIANRGEIGVRIVRTCREMGIATVALYDISDRGSLHVRLADECVQLDSPKDLSDPQKVIAIAQETGADAVHPGYGFLAEEAEFIRACEEADITFIGPPAEVVETLRTKIETLKIAHAAGFQTPVHSTVSYGDENLADIEAEAERLGYPVIIKSCSGGRGRGERLAGSPRQLARAVHQARAVGQAIYGNNQVYLEKAILPAYQVGVQIVADKHGNIIHLGEREGSVLQNGHKIVEEAPSLCLNQDLREQLWRTSLELGKLFNYENLGTVEFIVDSEGQFFFSEIKARIQVEHPLTEMQTRIDLVQEQIQVAAGEKLSRDQDSVRLEGWAMMCRVRANDPWRNFLPTPGKLKRVRLPGGPEVRVDTYIYCNCEVPAAYVPMLAKLTVWAENRDKCLQRLRRALEDFTIIGPPTNLPLLQRIVHMREYVTGEYTTDFRVSMLDDDPIEDPDDHLADLAAAAAVLYMHRNQTINPQISERMQGGWHKSSRRLPQ
ncbi:MAG: biotin carboxylase N-terminal domain-containing protein [Candidatus Promineifilaceae bacterium]|nr:biotin carboxylase N-terminal domain-containing protein [Candidatus Promineifilaceae bacterium]